MDPIRESIQSIENFLSQIGFFKPNTDIDKKVFSDNLLRETEIIFNAEHAQPAISTRKDKWDALFLQYDKVGSSKDISIELSFFLNYQPQKIEFLNLNASYRNLTRSYGKSYTIGKDWKDTFPTLSMIEKDLKNKILLKQNKFMPQNRRNGKGIR